jgi:hypothetical protein
MVSAHCQRGRTRRPLLGGAGRRRQLRRRDQIPLSAESGGDRARRRHRLSSDEQGLRAYADAAATAPDELTTITFLQNAPPLPFIPPDVHGTPVHVIMPCYAGNHDAGQQALALLRGLAGNASLADMTGPIPYPALYDLTTVAGVSRRTRSGMRTCARSPTRRSRLSSSLSTAQHLSSA